MKKTFACFAALIAAVMMLGFTSCNENNADNPLVGTWFYEEFPDRPEGVFNPQQTLVIKNATEFTYKFMGMNGQKVHYGYEEAGVYTIDGNTVTITTKKCIGQWGSIDRGDTPYPYTEKFTYTINGNTMTLNWIQESGYRPNMLPETLTKQ